MGTKNAAYVLLLMLASGAVWGQEGSTAFQANTAAGSASTVASPPSSGGAVGAHNATSANTTTGEASLPSHYAMRVCLPFNVLVLPGPATGNGTLTVNAEEPVINALQVSVTNGVLVLSINNDFETTHAIQVTVAVPDPANLQYVQNFGLGDVFLGPGFNINSSNVLSVSTTGLGGVYVFNATVPQLRVTSTGVGLVYVSGEIGSANVTGDGTAKLYLTGNVTGPVQVKLSGISTAYIQGTSGTAISGTADGLSKVLYTQGQCTAQASFQSMFGINIFGNPCQQVNADTAPTFTPTWSCGILSRGSSNCASPGGEAAMRVNATTTGPTMNTVSGPAGTVTTSTFTSGPGASASSGGMVGGTGMPPTGLFQQATGGQPALVDVSIPSTSGGLSVVSVECQDPPESLMMMMMMMMNASSSNATSA